MKKLIRCAFVALVLMPTAGSAQEYYAGLDAYLEGDYATALQEWRPLTEQGIGRAQTNLGFMYQKGYGVLQDYAEAVRWYQLAADRGYARAQNNLGLMYDRGYGVLQNYAEAVRWYRLAAEQGYARAQYNLGIMYGTGQGVPQDHATAHMWFNIAAANGVEGAAENRDVAENLMTAADISEAQRRARVCVDSGYQDCD